MDTTTGTDTNGKWVIRVSRTKFIVSIVVLLVIAFIIVVLTSLTSTLSFGTATGPTAGMMSPLSGSNRGMMYPEPPSDIYYPDYQQSSIADTREFLKTSYSAVIRTRDVASVVTDVKNIVKGADGRIDSISSSEKNGRISFIVAKSKFDALQTEIQAITHKKLYSETISSQNLLNQKQSIEVQTNNIVSTLEDLRKQKDALLTRHNQNVSVINSELSRVKTELASVRSNILENSDPTVIASLRGQETILIAQDSTQRQKLSAENSNYSTQKQRLESLIVNSTNNLTNVSKQDTQFTDTIETVSGYVSVSWVSYWGLANIFSPISPIIIIIVLAIIAWYYFKRRGYVPGFEWH